MHYFSNKFSKSLFFQADYDEIELQKISYDVILVTSWPLYHRKT